MCGTGRAAADSRRLRRGTRVDRSVHHGSRLHGGQGAGGFRHDYECAVCAATRGSARRATRYHRRAAASRGPSRGSDPCAGIQGDSVMLFIILLGVIWLAVAARFPRHAVWFVVLWVPVQGWFQLNVFNVSTATVLLYEFQIVGIYLVFFARAL